MLISAYLVMSAVLLFTLVLPSGNSPYLPLPLADHVMLLKGYLATSAGIYISQGNGPIPVEEFYTATNDRLTAPPAMPGPPDVKRKPLSTPVGHGAASSRTPSDTQRRTCPRPYARRALRRLSHGLFRWRRRGRTGGPRSVRRHNLCPRRVLGAPQAWLGLAHGSGGEPCE